jgi:hypothetical protein
MSEENHPPYGTPAWFFHEFWPLMFFGLFFLMTMSLPLLFTGFLSLHALLIAFALLAALGLVLVLPKLMAFYVLLMALAVFFLQPQAWQTSTAIGIIFLMFTVIGMVLLPQRKSKV